MATVTAAMVKVLRERTQAPMMECKNALDVAAGDIEGAIKVLRERGIAKQAKRADRDTAEGVVRARTGSGNRGAAAVMVSCETDFSARNDNFQALAEAAICAALELPAASATPESVLAARAGSGTVQALLDDAGNTIRENMAVRSVARFEGTCGAYQHFDGRSGAIVEVSAEGPVDSAEFGKVLRELCMHIVAAVPAPLAVDASGIPQKEMDAEREIFIKQAMESGKPQAIAEKMVGGRLQKFVAERALTQQNYVLDSEKTVAVWLDARAAACGVKQVKITGFARVRIGE